MKSKNFVVIVLIIVVVCLGLWWFTRPTDTPEKVAAASKKSDAPKLPISPAQRALPLPPIVTLNPSGNATFENVSASAESEAELKIVFADIARLYRASDLAALMQTYTEPDKLDRDQLRELQEVQAAAQRSPSGTNPFIEQMKETRALAFEDLATQTPTFSAAGDEVTFKIKRETEENSMPTLSEATVPLTFIKINGKWYFKSSTPSSSAGNSPSE